MVTEREKTREMSTILKSELILLKVEQQQSELMEAKRNIRKPLKASQQEMSFTADGQLKNGSRKPLYRQK